MKFAGGDGKVLDDLLYLFRVLDHSGHSRLVVVGLGFHLVDTGEDGGYYLLIGVVGFLHCISFKFLMVFFERVSKDLLSLLLNDGEEWSFQ